MNKVHFETWMAVTLGLLAAAVFFRFALQGYSYIAHALTFIAALIVLHRFAPPALWRAAAVLVSIGLFYFCAVEIPIILSARTDADAQRDYIVVLGAQVKGRQPTPSLYYRLCGAQQLMTDNPDCIAIVSGGQGDGGDADKQGTKKQGKGSFHDGSPFSLFPMEKKKSAADIYPRRHKRKK